VSNEIYHNNLAVLKDRFPQVHSQLLNGSNSFPFLVEPFTTECGQANALVTLADGRRIAFYEDQDIISSTEALMAAWQLDAQDILFCMGMGLGYYPLVAVRKFPDQFSVVIIEPHPAIFDLALKSVDLRPLLNYQNLAIFVGHRIKTADIINKLQFSIFLGKQRVVTHVASRVIFGGNFLSLERELKESISLTKDLWQTDKELGREMLSNIMANLPSLFDGAPIGKLKGALSGVPAVCVAAGPSLDEALPVLKAIQNNALIVALDSAVASLIQAGIQPHMVVTCDTREINFEKMRPFLDRLRHSILVFALEANPDNVRAFLGPARIAVAGDNSILRNWLDPMFNFNCNLGAMSTVSHTAILTLIELGTDPIALVGMDMAFNLEKSHAEQAVHQYNLRSTELLEIEGTKGVPVQTYRPLIDYTRHLERIISSSPVRFVNTSLNGILIKGTAVKSLAEFAESELDDTCDINRRLASMTWQYPVDHHQILATFASMHRQIEKFQNLCSQGLQQIRRLRDQSESERPEPDRVRHKKELFDFYDQLQQKNRKLIDILFSIRLAEIRQIELQRLRLRNQSTAIKDESEILAELRIIKSELSSQLDAAAVFRAHVRKTEDFYRQLSSLSKKIESHPDDPLTYTALARHYAGAGELMHAEMFYVEALKWAPDNTQIWLELAGMYRDARLWRVAREHIRTARQNFPEDDDIAAGQAEIENKISSIMDQIKEAWVRGDTATTRRLLNEYLQFYPHDEQANFLKGMMKELAATLALDFRKFHTREMTEKHFEELLTRAVRRLESLEIEEAIGIIEGLIDMFPAKAAALREKIGDCRILQQDYKSAVWHYAQVLKLSPQVAEIQTKINNARRTIYTES
jgi:hypothetical protein